MRHALPFTAVLVAACSGGTTGDVGTDDTGADTSSPPSCAPAAHASPMHRLSREAFDRSLRDVFGLDHHPGDALPPDPTTEGFATTSRGQAVGTAWVAQAFRIAGDVAAEVTAPRAWTAGFEAEDAGLVGEAFEVASADPGTWWWLDASDTFTTSVEVPESGTYDVGVRGAGLILWDDIGDPPEGVWPVVRLIVDDELAGTLSIDDEDVDRAPWTLPVALDAGLHTLRYELDVAYPYILQLDRFVVSWHAQTLADKATPARAWITCDAADRACARELLGSLGRRLWRRPLARAELATLVGYVQDDVDAGLATAVHHLLASPNFLFLPEPAGTRALTAHERAGRLANVLWASAPDDTLLDCADAGGLADTGDACGLAAQVQRMLADPRASAVLEEFAAQWLTVRGLADSDAARRPGASPELVASMEAETKGFVGAVLADDLPLSTLVKADFTVIDERLARHYGLAAPGPDGRVDGAGVRGGVLTQAAVLTATSDVGRTSPVRRGVLVLEQLVCDAPGAPPPQVPQLDTDTPVRDALASHTANPACAQCHETIDPVGLALEGFGPLGEEVPGVDASGTLPDGTELTGADALADWIVAHDRYAACVAEHLATWALRRAVGEDDACLLTQVAPTAEVGLATALTRLVTSPAFTHRVDGEAP